MSEENTACPTRQAFATSPKSRGSNSPLILAARCRRALVHPDTVGSRQIDYRISTYQPMAYVERHAHKVQEQIYHVLEGEGLMDIGNERKVVRKHDVIFLPPGVPHSIQNTGLGDLTFIVVTTPVKDE